MQEPATNTPAPAPEFHQPAIERPSRFLRALLWLQAVYFAVTGIWPLVHLSSFEAVTGEKFDDWLVQTVGALITVIGFVLLQAALRNRLALEVAILAVGSALALASVDVIFVANGTIDPIYLADAGAEALLIVAWLGGLVAWARRGPGVDSGALRAQQTGADPWPVVGEQYPESPSEIARRR